MSEERPKIMIEINQQDDIEFFPLSAVHPRGDIELDDGWDEAVIRPLVWSGISTRDLENPRWNILVKHDGKTCRLSEPLSSVMGGQIRDEMVRWMLDYDEEKYGNLNQIDAFDLVEDFNAIKRTFAYQWTWEKGVKSGYYYRVLTILISSPIEEESS